MNIQLAWRNIWRNKRRTLITSASIFFGVVLSSIMTSMQEGSYAQMIKTIVNSYSGHLQVLKRGYWDDKIINNSFEYTSTVQSILSKGTHITTIAPRFESYALASGTELTKGVMIMGIAPKEEDSITSLSKKIINGQYLENGDSSMVIGSNLAKYMQLNVNDTLVLLSQGYHGVSAAGKYRVKGIIRHPSPELDRSIVYLDVKQCQELFSAPNRLTSVVIMAQSTNDVNAIKKELEASLDNDLEVKDWKEINHILLKQIDSDRASGAIVKGILYLIIAFGIFGTIMMMTLERRKEFGVLMAVGMQKYRLGCMLLFETILIGLIGSISGIIASLPIAWYYFYHPIRFTGQAAESMLQMGFEPVMSFSLSPSVFYQQAFIILSFSLLIGLYPILITGRLKVGKALRS